MSVECYSYQRYESNFMSMKKLWSKKSWSMVTPECATKGYEMVRLRSNESFCNVIFIPD